MEARPDIGIKEAKEVMNVINNVYKHDFKDYALISFMRRLNRVLYLYRFNSAEELIKRLRKNHGFFDLFLRTIAIEETEIFRDPSLWRLFSNEIIPDHIEKKDHFKIWLPECVTGEELYSLLIILKESNALDKVEIIAYTSSNKSLADIKKGVIKQEKIKISEENYIRIDGKEGGLNKYYTKYESYAILNEDLLKNVSLIDKKNILESPPENNDIILFRNSMLYFNFTLKSKILEGLYNCLKKEGLFIIGTKETINNHEIANKFSVFSPVESIYQKK
jgi:chemotaxis protein methyltransferase CheR